MKIPSSDEEALEIEGMIQSGDKEAGRTGFWQHLQRWKLVAAAMAATVIFVFLFLCSLRIASHPLPQPYRSSFHFQPPNNWMNDPNGPMFYKGYYHLFYQWNPFGAVWGNITWGHAVSQDLIHWHNLELALVPDQWYDLCGCWTGSATFVAKDKPALLYTGCSRNVSASMDVQMQAMAVPADYNDPLLRKWVKIAENPILRAPPGISSTDFRDPTTGWKGSDGNWRIVVGSTIENSGLALLYTSSDFVHWEKAENPLHTVPLTGMWECPDFYPVPTSGKNGLDTSANGTDVRHVLKVSCREHDYYAVGTYVDSNDSFVPANPDLDAGTGLRYDYGKYYASKSFFDDNKGRRILWGWVSESDTSTSDIAKGWSSLQGIPRMIWLDNETDNSLLQWPIDEVSSLHEDKVYLNNLGLESGSVVEVQGIKGAQLDIEVAFELPDLNLMEVANVNAGNAQPICSQKGMSRRGVLGPFGLLVLASQDQIEQTAIFFYVVSSQDGLKALVCSDQSRSSLATEVDKTTYGSFISILRTERLLHLRVLVDNSIVETFAEGGKVCITSRVYPTIAIDTAAYLFVFNNGTTPVQVRNLEAWKMSTIK